MLSLFTFVGVVLNAMKFITDVPVPCSSDGRRNFGIVMGAASHICAIALAYAQMH